LTSTKKQFYKQRIAELQVQLEQRDERIAVLEKQVAEPLKANAQLTEKVAKLSKNSSNSSKPPSLDIVKPAKPKQADGRRHHYAEFHNFIYLGHIFQRVFYA
jgi:uncharacterized coiled-coil protein SlyX